MRTLTGLLLACASGAALAQGPSADPAAPPSAADASAEGARVAPVPAHRVAFAGSMGRQALLVIDGSTPRAVAVGATVQGVRLLELRPEEAVVEIDGQRHALRLGASALHLGGAPSPGSGSQITLSSDANGHFLTSGRINGRGVTFLVDTGATLVALGPTRPSGSACPTRRASASACARPTATRSAGASRSTRCASATWRSTTSRRWCSRSRCPSCCSATASCRASRCDATTTR